MGTSHTLESCPKLAVSLERWIRHGYDFGSIYARVRYGRDLFPDHGIDDSARRLSALETRRSSALDPATNSIVDPHLPPRRIWDLVSNRVLLHDGTARLDGAISHSWVAPAQRQHVRTLVNNYEWPVPIPCDTTLERVRIELLNLERNCVWLDVLCLRQEGAPDKESIRRDEWTIDVPTIGAVYHGTAFVIHYYSGLGRPFKVGDLNSERGFFPPDFHVR
ncbi:hypothetical protein AURDEDRAFT_160230 [Auricularia subglabra TFB-10046 SS5]|nr:hypothetical protein AURDEDRAFT_160230 [Auricularia subglabra TFB-10046 SS5]